MHPWGPELKDATQPPPHLGPLLTTHMPSATGESDLNVTEALEALLAPSTNLVIGARLGNSWNRGRPGLNAQSAWCSALPCRLGSI